MSRLQDAINRLELVAKKMEMSIEDALSILEGRHATHVVTQKYKEVEPQPANPTTNPPTAGAATSNSTPQTASTASTASVPSAAIPSTSEAGNPIGSGDAAASAGVGTQAAAGSTVNAGSAHNED